MIWAPTDYLSHHGILGMKWGVRRYQNPDGTLTNAGRRRLRRLQQRSEKKDLKWIRKNQDKIYRNAYKQSKAELNEYGKQLARYVNPRLANGKVSKQYAAHYNVKMAELMNRAIGDLPAPSGKVVRFVAKRGEIGVHTALADIDYDMSNVKRGVYGSGKVAYKKQHLDRV